MSNPADTADLVAALQYLKRPCRGVITTNVAALATFTVAAGDGVTFIQGDRVLLVGQSTAAQNGIYVVGVVGAGTAPLTRAADFATGDTFVNGHIVDVSEGTIWKNSRWKATCVTTGGGVVDTNDPVYYPSIFKKTVTLSSGAYIVGAGGGGEPLFLLAGASVGANRNTANTSTATTGGYTAPAATRTTGIAGTAAVTVRAEVAAGTLNAADISTVDVEITNWN